MTSSLPNLPVYRTNTGETCRSVLHISHTLKSFPWTEFVFSSEFTIPQSTRFAMVPTETPKDNTGVLRVTSFYSLSPFSECDGVTGFRDSLRTSGSIFYGSKLSKIVGNLRIDHRVHNSINDSWMISFEKILNYVQHEIIIQYFRQITQYLSSKHSVLSYVL